MDKNEFLMRFQADFFIPQLDADTKEEVLKEMVGYISDKSHLKDNQLIIDMLERREKLGSTGIGEGIAIPHGRSLSAPDLIVSYGISNKGIDYDSIDEKPVYLIFMIIAPPQEQSNIYLPFLGKLVEILKNDDIREKLQEAQTHAQFVDTLAGGFV